MVVDGMKMNAFMESGRNSVSEHQVQAECGE